MAYEVMNYDQGHWLLAKMGKKVLRPGGRILTEDLIENLNISNTDDVVEFAPGIGHTAKLTLKRNPNTYTAVEVNRTAAKNLKRKFKKKDIRIVNSSAAKSGLTADSADKVYGEAMLTMQSDKRKSEIVKEAYRLLKKGGLYGIHELGLHPNDLGEESKRSIQLGLIKAIKVNARPMTTNEWIALLEKEGFEVVEVMSKPMLLLDPKRILEDEGLFRTIKIAFNMMTHPKERKRIEEMQAIFHHHREKLRGVAIIARKK